MWAYTNNTPFAVERGWVRDRAGAEIWVVAVKGTFAIGPEGSLALADAQEPVRRTPEFARDPASSSMVYDADLGHPKPTTDVIVNGHAYAPGGRPATRVEVAMRVGPVAKSLQVVGDRHWRPGPLGPVASSATPFLTVPLVYERAYGGRIRGRDSRVLAFDDRNPAGPGFAVDPDLAVGLPLPNVEHPGAQLTLWLQRPEPAGFAAIARHWVPRARLAGTYDERWRREKLPLPPDDFDERFYLCAPVDQQAPAPLQGGEPVDLRNLTAEGRLTFRLPKLVVGLRTRFTDGGVVHHRAGLHTVIVEPDVPRLMVVWHAALPCHHKVLKLRCTTVYLKRWLDHRQVA
jgi:hypothetical protein